MGKKKKVTTITPRLSPWAEEAQKEIPLAEYPRPSWHDGNGRA